MLVYLMCIILSFLIKYLYKLSKSSSKYKLLDSKNELCCHSNCLHCSVNFKFSYEMFHGFEGVFELYNGRSIFKYQI